MLLVVGGYQYSLRCLVLKQQCNKGVVSYICSKQT